MFADVSVWLHYSQSEIKILVSMRFAGRGSHTHLRHFVALQPVPAVSSRPEQRT